ncbi:hypothetical protein [Amycolatopsis sp. NPDC051372]|uniref:hypothetical protein n=1 Tax=Amycolatopsis sp. NPDC051372 TaxID=3155669 RepID=UPI00341F2B30
MTTTERPHGRTKYLKERCRCSVCRAANSRYENMRKLRPTTLVDAGPVREHVNMLREHGLGTRRIATLAGMPRQNIQALLYGKRPTKRMRPEGAARILAIKPGTDEPTSGARMDACGARRRLQALVSNGWCYRELAERLGCNAGHVGKLMRAGRLRYSTVTRIKRMFDELWDVAPPENTVEQRRAAARARSHAVACGWAPAMAWDDDTIDDPDAAAEGAGFIAHGRKLPPLDELQWLLESESERAIAHRFGVTEAAIYHALRRAA